SRHVIGYLQDFLFSPQEARSPIRNFSGGQRNRLLLARLFASPANLLVLDEPTNDLDSETLELLEARLVEYQGSVLLVSHDRAFLNNVVTSTLALEGDQVREYVGGYDDWVRQRKATAPSPPPRRAEPARSVDPPRAAEAPPSRPKKLSFNQQRELDQLPARIEQLEAEVAALHAAMADPAFYKEQSPETIAAQSRQEQELAAELAAAFARWEELDAASR
ncbi:MAG TPA: ATP-binding cassette domain-containing protein, partial [Lacipirellulaceae bacterium]|nr:ATP-binding cassette domain-containing protein [Lacipirellulaceae bacterium]